MAIGKRNLKTQKAVAHAARAPQLFGFWVLLCRATYSLPIERLAVLLFHDRDSRNIANFSGKMR